MSLYPYGGVNSSCSSGPTFINSFVVSKNSPRFNVKVKLIAVKKIYPKSWVFVSL